MSAARRSRLRIIRLGVDPLYWYAAATEEEAIRLHRESEDADYGCGGCDGEGGTTDCIPSFELNPQRITKRHAEQIRWHDDLDGGDDVVTLWEAFQRTRKPGLLGTSDY